MLLEATNDVMPIQPLDAVAHVVRAAVQRAAAGAIEALGNESAFVVRLVLDLACSFETSADQRGEGQYFDLGADRAVANALPAFLTPPLASLLALVEATRTDVRRAGMAIAGKAPLETRLFLARGCDIIWNTPCYSNPCIHDTAITWLLETARGAEIGPWDMHTQRSRRVYIEGDVPARLQSLDGSSVDLSMLDAPIRGLGAAAAADHCRTAAANNSLLQLLEVQRRAIVTHAGKGRSVDHRGTHALIAARAILDGHARDHDPQPVLQHLDGFSHDAGLLSGFLHGLAAAGAETERLGQAARDLWPVVVDRCLTYAEQDPNPYCDDHWGDWAVAALLPEPLSWTRGLHNEVAASPIEWVDAAGLLDLIDRWIPLGRGQSRCVDALIRILRKLPVAQQVDDGLTWITELCIQADRVRVKQTWLSNDWLREVRSAAEDLNRLVEWQKLVDAMVVAGNEELAPYSR